MTTVERREAQRQSHLARAALARLRRRPIARFASRVSRKHPGASRGSIAFAHWRGAHHTSDAFNRAARSRRLV